ncbi:MULTISPECIES: ABC transporter ATP-binding protein [Pseudomonadaceae]|uniref:ABC transporter ATP-binding protein/permease n=2 Tax=Stutzerimonas kunmingensis TaxID=1211807 RepID=A0A9X1N7R9_9GAMM|nr:MULTISPECIES: ABC transporter ATP-binding protein [Pseudomonadaceae]MCD1610536.1 ABC transporter ATP-binding protein/permease [Stutzerimonas kunmingensis]QTB75914.1 ABC transporter ATP-binding protein [Pseudomonas aeruginosa]QTB88054.1 ABC transporter ATP-binding protein [Pseudomonas aeruginosa]
MRMLFAFGRAYPTRTALMLVSLLLAGLAEGVGLTTLLPLLSITLGDQTHSGFSLKVIDALHAVGLEPTIVTMLVIIVVGMTASSTLVLLGNRQVGYTVAHVATDLRLALIRALLGSRWEYYLRQPAGALANAVATEAYRASTGYEHAANMVALVIQALVYAVIALFVSWPATLISLLLGLFLLVALRRLVTASRKAGKSQTRLMRGLLTRLTDTLGSVKPLKAMAREDIADSLLRREAAELNTAMEREVMSREALRALQEPMLAMLAAGGLYAGLIVFELPLSSVMVLIFLVVRVLGLLHKAQQRYHRMAAQEAAYWALQGAIDTATADAEPRGGEREPTLEQAIVFEGVSFGYGDRLVLDTVDLRLQVGTFTSLIGPSGAGKTTILDLLSLLLAPQAGRILVDGVPIDTLDRRRWRRFIGYVPQDTLLLHDSVLANVTLGDPALTREQAEGALRQAGAWEFVERMPDGMDSVVGERGGKLSGGQRQRIAIARALAHGPRLLILDEATSALDPESEEAISQTLRRLTPAITIIAVSHRPALVNVADQVFRLCEGKLASVNRELVQRAFSSE